MLCPILVGRDELLELADRRVAEAAAGRGGLLLLAGQAGIGKSRLLSSIRRKARAAGFLVATGAVAPQDRVLPAALVLELGAYDAAAVTGVHVSRAVVETQLASPVPKPS